MLESDQVKFIVELRVDPLCQKPLLPLSILLRKYLIEELAGLVRTVGKFVGIDYYRQEGRQVQRTGRAGRILPALLPYCDEELA
ncbi:MAG: hypothetical protein NT102_04965 [Caldiserica bacterium]|nr:hypothetical protein [Caldisericota bacterium]